MKAFKAYDIRGIYGKDFDKETVYKIGFFLPRLFNAQCIAVGRDIRLSSQEIFEALSQGILDAGCDVDDFGLTTTPMTYWISGALGYKTTVMITASHNPKSHNGLKISGPDVKPVGYDGGLKMVEDWVENESIIVAAQKGELRQCNKLNEYLEFQKQFIPDFGGMRLVVDCCNGMANLFAKEFFPKGTLFIGDTMDGNFPIHEPNPLEAENRKLLSQRVKENHADLGVIFDGDADRVMFVDENGDFLPPDLLIGLMGDRFLSADHKGERVLQDIRTSKSTAERVTQMGGEIHMWRVGRAYAAQKLREIDGIYGGELAGHYYFRDFFYSDSGCMAALILIGIFVQYHKQGKKVSEVMKEICHYANSGEINFTIEDKTAAMKRIKEFFCQQEQPSAIMDFDGYRVEFKDWWFNIRPSNTEPFLRLIAEARTKELLEMNINQIKRLLNQ